MNSVDIAKVSLDCRRQDMQQLEDGELSGKLYRLLNEIEHRIETEGSAYPTFLFASNELAGHLAQHNASAAYTAVTRMIFDQHQYERVQKRLSAPTLYAGAQAAHRRIA